jgi:glycosyltransferase involved in cell wall biosynthesis
VNTVSRAGEERLMSANAADAAADLHCHSSASGPNGNWWYAQLEIADSKTPPEDVYGQAKAAGMSFVTLTDHDTIEGALELVRHPDFIVGEEVTVFFPDDGARIDVVVLGLDWPQHCEIVARRDDAYALVRYLRAERLVHFLAHPIYDPANAISAGHLARLARLFPLWETRNGARIHDANALADRLHRDLGDSHLADPTLGPPPGLGAVGGSDDHGGTDVGTTYTVTPPAADAEEFLEHLRTGRCRPAGVHAEPARMTHMVMRLLDRHRKGGGGQYDEVWRSLASGEVTHKEVARLAEAIALGSAATTIELPFADPNGIGRELTKLRRYASAQARLVPYLGVQIYLARERCGVRALSDRLGKCPRPDALKVALIADGLTNVNGIAESYREMLPELSHEVSVTPLACGPLDGLSSIELTRAETLSTPIYPELDLPLPHLSELFERIFDIDADLVHVTAPGPLGLLGMAAAKLLRLPVVASYHTELGEYADALTGDPLLAEVIRTATARFYAAAEVIVSPSPTTAANLPELLGVAAERIAVVPQGVDCDRFSPVHRDRAVFSFAGDCPVILCVGRLSHEKGLDRLVRAADEVGRRRNVHLVIVGDGPARPELEALADGHVTFVGWLHGTQLSRAFASADLFVLPSATETGGQVLLEAQASGLPCIISPTGAARDMIVADVTGLIAPSDRAEAFAASIEILLDDATRRARLSKAARANARSRSWRTAAAALTDAYERAMTPPEHPSTGAPSCSPPTIKTTLSV